MKADKVERQKRLMNTGLRIGKHCTGGKQLLAGLSEALDAPSTAMQLFAGNPHRYWSSATTDEDRELFVEATHDFYVMVHSVYITNLGENPIERAWKYTCHSLVNQLEWADAHGADAFVFHPGSAKDNDKADALDWVVDGLRDVLSRYAPDQEPEYQKGRTLNHKVRLCLENDANPNRNRKVGAKFDELLYICEQIGDKDRVGIVIDTTHAFAAGYSVQEIIDWVKDHDEWVEAIHFNTPDTGVTCGSAKDRHSQCLADGAFSLAELAHLFQAFRHKPLILEGTPDLSSDLSWMLSWELEIRKNGKVSAPKVLKSHHEDDIFSLADDLPVVKEASAQR